MCQRMTLASRRKTLTPSTSCGRSGWSPRAEAGAVYELSSGSTAAMSRIAAAGVSRVMIIPGGMIAPWVSSALSRRLTVCPRRMTPSRAATTVTRATAAICGRVAVQRIGDPIACPAIECPAIAPSALGESAVACARTVIRPCFMLRATSQTLTG